MKYRKKANPNSKKEWGNLVRRRLRRQYNNFDENSASHDSMGACRRLYGQGKARG